MKMSNSEARRHSKRHNRLEIRLSDEELAVIKKKAESLGLSVSAYLRRIGIVGEIINFDFSYWNDFRIALVHIGSNINQIAKAANSMQTITEKDIRDVLVNQSIISDHLTEIRDKLIPKAL